MWTNFVRLCASFLFVVFLAPQAFAQNADGAKDEDEKDFADYYHTGTMTPPNQETMDVKYVMSMVDGEHTAWIVTEAWGEDVKIEMMDLQMNQGVVSYAWSPPDSDVIISCELESVDDGGWAGDCISDDNDQDIGRMTMGPMMNHDADRHADHEYDEGDHAEHDVDDDGDSVPAEDDESDS